LYYRRAELAKEGLYVADSLVGYDNPSHFSLSLYSLNQDRMSSAKDFIPETKEPGYYLELKRHLEVDILRHYQEALKLGCKDVVWSNEGLYLLNSTEEYQRLFDLFDDVSSEVTCLCCFRDVESYKSSYIEQLAAQEIPASDDEDSYRYINDDSWLFDFDRKKQLLDQVFDRSIVFSYTREDMVKKFMDKIGYSSTYGDTVRINISPKV
jgi:hypothetical protein